MGSNFERLQKITNQAYIKDFSCLFHMEPGNLPCQDPPTCDQDDLVLSMSNTTIRKNQMTKSGIASSISFSLLKMAIVLPIFFLYRVFKIG